MASSIDYGKRRLAREPLFASDRNVFCAFIVVLFLVGFLAFPGVAVSGVILVIMLSVAIKLTQFSDKYKEGF